MSADPLQAAGALVLIILLGLGFWKAIQLALKLLRFILRLRSNPEESVREVVNKVRSPRSWVPKRSTKLENANTKIQSMRDRLKQEGKKKRKFKR